jgi:hypothetical protein
MYYNSPMEDLHTHFWDNHATSEFRNSRAEVLTRLINLGVAAARQTLCMPDDAFQGLDYTDSV